MRNSVRFFIDNFWRNEWQFFPTNFSFLLSLKYSFLNFLLPYSFEFFIATPWFSLEVNSCIKSIKAIFSSNDRGSFNSWYRGNWCINIRTGKDWTKFDGGISQLYTEIEKVGSKIRAMYKQLMSKENVWNQGTHLVSSPRNKDGTNSSHAKTIPLSLLVESMDTTGRSCNQPCKHGKLECPRFDGGDFSWWLMKLEQFFEAEKVEDDAKVCTMMMQLEGRALQRHHHYIKTKGSLVALN